MVEDTILSTTWLQSISTMAFWRPRERTNWEQAASSKQRASPSMTFKHGWQDDTWATTIAPSSSLMHQPNPIVLVSLLKAASTLSFKNPFYGLHHWVTWIGLEYYPAPIELVVALFQSWIREYARFREQYSVTSFPSQSLSFLVAFQMLHNMTKKWCA